MSLSKYDTGDGSGIPKWQIALAVGGAVILGIGIYYFILKDDESKRIRSKGDSTAREKESSTESKNADKASPVSSREDSEKEEDLSNLDLNVFLPNTAIRAYKLRNFGILQGSDYPEEVQKVETHQKQYLETPLEQAQAYKNKGNKYFRGGKFSLAIKCYDDAISSCPRENGTDLSTFYQNRAAAYEQMKNWENVLRDCTAALELNNKYIKALQRRAKACEQLNDLEQALEDLTAVCILETFQNQATLVHVDRVLKELGRQHAKEMMVNRKPVMPSKYVIKTFFESFAEDPLVKSLYKEKESDIDETEHIPEKYSVNNGYLQAIKNLREGNYSEIVSMCSNELANPLTSFKCAALMLRGTLYLLRAEMKAATADFTAVINMNENEVSLKIVVNALVKRGSIYMQQDQVSESLKDYGKAATLDSSNSDVFHHRGQIHLLMGNIELAMADFEKATSLNSNFPIASVQRYYTEYRYAHQMGDKIKIQQVIECFEKAIQNFPKCSECYVLYAQVLSDQSEFEKADECYIKALEVDPENPTILVHKAMLILQWRGDLEEARSLLNKSLEMDDKCELAYENLATIEVQTGNLQKGVELFDKAIGLARTEVELAHLFSLRDAAVAQLKIFEKLNIHIPNIGSL